MQKMCIYLVWPRGLRLDIRAGARTGLDGLRRCLVRRHTSTRVWPFARRSQSSTTCPNKQKHPTLMCHVRYTKTCTAKLRGGSTVGLAIRHRHRCCNLGYGLSCDLRTDAHTPQVPFRQSKPMRPTAVRLACGNAFRRCPALERFMHQRPCSQPLAPTQHGHGANDPIRSPRPLLDARFSSAAQPVGAATHRDTAGKRASAVAASESD